jgi:hypothetical protein
MLLFNMPTVEGCIPDGVISVYVTFLLSFKNLGCMDENEVAPAAGTCTDRKETSIEVVHGDAEMLLTTLAK